MAIGASALTTSAQAADITPTEARAIAKEAYIYAYPMVDRSLTMYELPASLLVANPINRYLINSPTLLQLKKDADGGLTLLQNESPGSDKEVNWCPLPKALLQCV